jgi:adenylosuccinate synthase
MGKLQVVVGGQYGSEGKGMIAGYLAALEESLMAVRVAGSNAGHTVWGANAEGEQEQYQLRHLPVAAITNRKATLALAAGSELEIPVLAREMGRLMADGYGVDDRIMLDNQATIVTLAHQEREAAWIGTGTTGKGIGAARADRAMRAATIYRDLDHFLMNLPKGVDVADETHLWMGQGGTVMIEGTQGYGLGLHAGWYPYCTSSDCRAIDFMAMAGISPWAPEIDELEIWIVYRVHPIRIAGNSGPLANETSWESIGVPEEYTTVTKKVRRVGLWDGELATRALWANGGNSERVHVALTFADYLVPEIHGQTTHDALFASGLLGHIEKLESELDFPIELIGTGPGSVIDRRPCRIQDCNRPRYSSNLCLRHGGAE